MLGHGVEGCHCRGSGDPNSLLRKVPRLTNHVVVSEELPVKPRGASELRDWLNIITNPQTLPSQETPNQYQQTRHPDPGYRFSAPEHPWWANACLEAMGTANNSLVWSSNRPRPCPTQGFSSVSAGQDEGSDPKDPNHQPAGRREESYIDIPTVLFPRFLSQTSIQHSRNDPLHT
jgi:hypothetical protein